MLSALLILASGFSMWMNAAAIQPTPSTLYQQRSSTDSSTNWTSLGCFTDSATSRTLDQTSIIQQPNLTVEACLEFCTSGEFILAGVEFGQECYCDYAIQYPGTQASSDNCATPCTGNASETCGGSSFINVYTNGEPGPSIVQDIDSWVYQGCYSDNITERTIANPMVINGGVTVESCTIACRSNGDFAFAGLEFSQECYCANTLSSSGTLVPDTECQRACTANTSEFCGGLSRISTYKWSPTSLPSNPQQCVSVNDGVVFVLQAVYEDDETSVPVSVIADGFPDIGSAVLSACGNGQTCLGLWNGFTLADGVLLPQSGCAVGGLLTISVSEDVGETPMFGSTLVGGKINTSSSYCVMDNFLIPGGPPVLAANERSDLWALCANSTAGTRLDVVFNPQAGNPGYDLSAGACRNVSLQVVA